MGRLTRNRPLTRKNFRASMNTVWSTAALGTTCRKKRHKPLARPSLTLTRLERDLRPPGGAVSEMRRRRVMETKWEFAIVAILFGTLVIKGQQAMHKHAIKSESDSAWAE